MYNLLSEDPLSVEDNKGTTICCHCKQNIVLTYIENGGSIMDKVKKVKKQCRYTSLVVKDDKHF